MSTTEDDRGRTADGDLAGASAGPVVAERADARGPRGGYPADVDVVAVDGREFVLVGTAHISHESADLVREVIANEHPDCVCIELDKQRYEALAHGPRFESLDLKEVLRRRQMATLMMNLILASYQKQLGGKLGVRPGAELLEAARVAEEIGVPVALCDREVRVTLRRAWGAMSAWRKLVFVTSMLGSLFERPELTEDDIRELRQQDVVSKLMQELGEAFPDIKSVLIDERDGYLTEKIRAATGARIVAVVGAGHVQGMKRALLEHRTADLAELESVPPVSSLWKWFGWGIPLLIVGSIAAIGWRHGAAAARHNLLFWILAHSIPSVIGAGLALAHPAAALVAFVVAPFTSLTPLIGAGYVAAFAQTYFRPPLVRELQSVSEDAGHVALWWKNRLLRIFLVFLLTTLGSSIGTFVGGAEILRNLVRP